MRNCIVITHIGHDCGFSPAFCWNDRANTTTAMAVEESVTQYSRGLRTKRPIARAAEHARDPGHALEQRAAAAVVVVWFAVCSCGCQLR